jgi:glycosyltransferase involved in cell wall biosynthesis
MGQWHSMNSQSSACHYIAVVPAYNEAATIRDIVTRTLQQVSDVIVVDDGSVDATASALEGLPVTLLRNPVNMGKSASLWRGMQHALEKGAQAVITLDGDGQHRPEEIPALIAGHSARPEAIIIGSRLHRRTGMPGVRYGANLVANFWVSLLAGYSIPDSQSGFRIYPAELLRRVRVGHSAAARFTLESEILIEAGRMGVRSVAVPVMVSYLALPRASHYAPIADTCRITSMIVRKLLRLG